MSDNKLAILGIVAVITAAAAIVVNRIGETNQQTNLVIGPLIGGLDVDSIAKITVNGNKGTNKVTLAKKDNQFVVVEKDNYPASAKKVNELVNSCLDIRTAELRTQDPAFHKDLGVTEDTAKTIVTFSDSSDKPITGVIISDSKPDSQEAFVRLISENKTYLITQSPWINCQPVQYIYTQLLEVDSKKISEVIVTDPNNTSYTLKSDNGGDTINLVDMPAGRQFKGTDYRRVFTALSSLNFDDVILKTKLEGLVFDRKFICKLNDSTVYSLNLAKKDNKTYLELSVDFLDKSAVTKEKGVESEEQLKQKEAKLLARDAAESLSKKTAGWLYVIPEYKASDLIKSLKELIEDIPPKTTPADPNQPAKPNVNEKK